MRLNKFHCVFMRILLIIKTRKGGYSDNSEKEPSHFETIDNVLYFIDGKTKIRIKETFSETKTGITDLIKSVIQYEEHADFIL